MKLSLRKTCSGAALLMGMAAMPAAHALDTLVQWSTTGSGDGTDASYNLFDINEFDWQSSGDLVVEQDLTGTGSEANGTVYDSFALWVANAVVGDTVEFEIHAQARLNDMLLNSGAGVLPSNISGDGTSTGCADGAGCIEVTGALDGTETAEAIFRDGAGNLTIAFTGISGTYTWWVDTSPDSVVDTGAGFNDGTFLLGGNLVDSSGTFTQGGSGSVILTNSVTSYNTDYIQTDPDSLAPLTGTTFDTLISLRSAGEAAAHDVGDVIGQAPYTVSAIDVGGGLIIADIGLKADANSEFTAAIPEPTTLALMGLGLFGLGGFNRLRRRSSLPA